MAGMDSFAFMQPILSFLTLADRKFKVRLYPEIQSLSIDRFPGTIIPSSF